MFGSMLAGIDGHDLRRLVSLAAEQRDDPVLLRRRGARVGAGRVGFAPAVDPALRNRGVGERAPVGGRSRQDLDRERQRRLRQRARREVREPQRRRLRIAHSRAVAEQAMAVDGVDRRLVRRRARHVGPLAEGRDRHVRRVGAHRDEVDAGRRIVLVDDVPTRQVDDRQLAAGRLRDGRDEVIRQRVRHDARRDGCAVVLRHGRRAVREWFPRQGQHLETDDGDLLRALEGADRDVGGRLAAARRAHPDGDGEGGQRKTHGR